MLKTLHYAHAARENDYDMLSQRVQLRGITKNVNPASHTVETTMTNCPVIGHSLASECQQCQHGMTGARSTTSHFTPPVSSSRMAGQRVHTISCRPCNDIMHISPVHRTMLLAHFACPCTETHALHLSC